VGDKQNTQQSKVKPFLREVVCEDHLSFYFVVLLFSSPQHLIIEKGDWRNKSPDLLVN
jgi:hypothetical protein